MSFILVLASYSNVTIVDKPKPLTLPFRVPVVDVKFVMSQVVAVIAG
jgi:hypothetical protein